MRATAFSTPSNIGSPTPTASRGSAFDNAANTIARLVRFGDGGNHTLALSVVENRERLRMRH